MNDQGFLGDEMVRRVKEATDIAQLMGEYATLKRAGNDMVACCPFHHEKTPSLHVYVDQGTFHCFGCGAHGDAIGLYQQKENLEFKDAVQALARRAGIPVTYEHGGQRGPTRSETDTLKHAVEFAAAFYEQQLWAMGPDAAARAYLAERAITADTIRRFRLGWAPGHGQLVEAARRAGIEPKTLMVADLALERDGRVVDRFFERITFPICDRFGNPIAFSARLLPEAETALRLAGKSVGKYINSTDTPIYRKGATVYNLHRAGQHCRDKKRLVVMEGAVDVIAADQAGFPECVAVLGTALTADHCRELCKKVGDSGPLIVVFDGDDAGKTSSEKAVRTCLAAGVATRVAKMPPDLDPAQLFDGDSDPEDAKKAFEEILATTLADVHHLMHAAAPVPGDLDSRQRLEVLDELLETLGLMPDAELRGLYAADVGKHLGLERALVRKRLAGIAKPPGTSTTDGSDRGAGGHRKDKSEGAPVVNGLDDQGNAERFVKRHGKNLRFCFEFGVNGWFVWTGTHWKQDKSEEVNRLVIETLNTVLGEEAQAMRDSGRPISAVQIDRWLRTSRNQRKIEAVLTVAQKEPGIGVNSPEFNKDPWLFACASGTIDLRTGEQREANRDDLITRCSPTHYKKGAVSERWQNFLAQLTSNDKELELYLQRAAGYSTSGSTREEVTFLIQGEGGSGKSTFMSALDTTLGDYAETIDFEMFLASNVGKRETYYAAIESARLVQCEESEENRQFASGVVKKVTGGNRLQARHLYGSSYSYVPKFKVWMVTNDLPRVSDTDSGFWRRVQVIRCMNVIAANKIDRDYKAWLRTDPSAGEALLAWCVAGAAAYHAGGLAPPESVIKQNAAYRLANDPIQEFLDEHTSWGTANTDYVVTADFLAAYKGWVESSNQGRPLSAKALCKRLEARGATRGKVRLSAADKGPVASWRGFRMRDGRDHDRAPNAPKPGTATPPPIVPGSIPTDPVDTITSLLTAPGPIGGIENAVPGSEAGIANTNASNDATGGGIAGSQTLVRTREDASLLISPSSDGQNNTGIAIPVSQDPPTSPTGEVPRGTKKSRPPDASEDLFADATPPEPDDFDPPF